MRVGALHHNQQFQLRAFLRQGGFDQGNGVPTAGKQHDESELLTQHGQTAIFDIASATADVAGDGIDDPGAVGTERGNHEIVFIWLRQNGASCRAQWGYHGKHKKNRLPSAYNTVVYLLLDRQQKYHE
ncbi:hypothetical protein SPRA44_570027 [Serratia proteamaculans]|nr:hypothetical protein SPRA44_570027 [Serratia proteamaculans]